MDKRSDALEEMVAHLIRAVDDLSDVVARQDTEIARLTRRVEALLRAEAEREIDRARQEVATALESARASLRGQSQELARQAAASVLGRPL